MDDLELYKLDFSENFAGFCDLGCKATTAKRMKIDPYRQRQRCNPRECTFPVPCVDLPYSYFVTGLHTRTVVARLP